MRIRLKTRMMILFTALIAAAVSLIFPFPSPAFALPSQSPADYEGIDVSRWQGEIDFARIKESGIRVVYIRASHGTCKDVYFQRNYDGAKENGLLIGLYHNLTAQTVDQAREEARFFLSVIRHTLPDCRLAMDFETFGSLDTEAINAISLAFLETVERESGKEMVVYSDSYNARRVFSRQIAERYPLWVAEYGADEPEIGDRWKSWIGWQYTSGGRVSGIRGNVDRDLFTKEILLTSPAPLPEPAKPVPTDPRCTVVWVTIRRGDTLSLLARRYGTSVAQIAEENRIADPNLIYVGQRLCICAGRTHQANTVFLDYTVKKGDTLFAIAKRYDTSVRSILGWNTIANPNLIYPGEVLKLRTPLTGPEDAMVIRYTVKRGDTLFAIAKRYGVTVGEIAKNNDIADPNLIYTGEVLCIPRGREAFSYPTDDAYAVKQGDTAAAIAKRYGISIQALMAANGLSGAGVLPSGRILVIPQRRY